MTFENLNEQEILGRIRKMLEATPSLQPPIDSDGGVSDLDEQVFLTLTHLHQVKDPTLVPRETRMRLFKRVVQRMIRTFSSVQMDFNHAVAYILNALSFKTKDLIRQNQSLAESNKALTDHVAELKSLMIQMLDAQQKIGETHQHQLARLSDAIAQKEKSLAARIEAIQKEAGELREAYNRIPLTQMLSDLYGVNKRIDDETKSIYNVIEINQKSLTQNLREAESLLHKRIEDEKSAIYKDIEKNGNTFNSLKDSLSTDLAETKTNIHKRIDDEKAAIYAMIDQIREATGASELAAINQRIDDEKKAIYEVFDSLKIFLTDKVDKNAELMSDRIGHTGQMLHKRIDDEKAGIIQSLPSHESIDAKVQEAKDHAAHLAELLDGEVKKLSALLTTQNIFRMVQQENSLTGDIYFDFEKNFRGTPEVIRERQEFYLKLLSENHASLADNEGFYLDIGCGRGEMLSLLKEAGIPCRGVDNNSTMVKNCKDINLDVTDGEALEFLKSLPDNHLRGAMALQVIEHISIRELFEMFYVVNQKLKPGGIFIVETINPESFYALRWFYMDWTHNRPLPAPLVEFFYHYSGFRDVAVSLRSPVEGWRQMAMTENNNIADDNFNKLNNLLFGYQDYMIRGIK